MHFEDEWQENPIYVLNKRSADEENLAPTESKRRKRDCETRDGSSSRTGFTVDDYTVGWVCALHIEMAAAKSMLDEIHDNLGKSPNDSNTYIFGSLHRHNVAIACLPADGYGTNNAAIVASNMRRTFPSIRMFLMVGIGGGVPGKVDIRLGDVVVSTGVIQYDLGKTTHQGHFQPTGITRQPLPTLMTAVSALRAHHESESSKIPVILTQMRERHPSMTQYADCEPLQDLLFSNTYDHAESTKSCDNCDKFELVNRSPRSSNGPTIHYGIIASGNRVVKHAGTRDRLAQEFNAICFEMEAAGLMESLQCLVIRGICDYSDSHKSKQWQKYASATAAAYAKELLSVIPTIGTEATPTSMYVPS
jgi:nucleoside phosphorylase